MLTIIPSFTKKEVVIPEQNVVTKEVVIPEQKGLNVSNFPHAFLFSGHNFTFNHHTDINQIIDSYLRIAPVNGAVNLICNAIAGLPIILFDKNKKEKLDDHPILDLLDSPNKEEQTSKEALFFQLAFWKLLEGDFYLNAIGNINNTPLELFILKPQFMQIRINHFTGFPDTFTFNSGEIAIEIFKKEPKTGRIFNTRISNFSELLHDKNFNPLSASHDPTGMSEITPLSITINLYDSATQHNTALLNNGATPSGAMIFEPRDVNAPNNLSDEQYARLKNQMEEEVQGAGNAARPLLLEGGLKWEQMALSPKEMDFEGIIQHSEEMIYKDLGIPIQLKVPQGATMNNKREARQEFYENRVIPMMDEILSSLTTFLLINRGEENLEFQVDLENVDALMLKRIERIKSITENPTLTLNRKLQLQKEEEVAGGDVVFTAGGVGIAGDGLAEADETPIDDGVEEDD